MATITEKLYKWSLQELNLVSEGSSSRIPDVETLKTLTKGKNKKIWNYVINHVRSQSTVDKVKRTLYLRKQLKQQEDNSVYFTDDSTTCEKVKESLSSASKKHKYLMCSLSTVQERIVSLDQTVKKTKDEVFQINQKIALLELLNQNYGEKNLKLKNLIFQISSYQSALNAYQSSKLFDKIAVDLSYDFLCEKVLYDENMSRMKDLVIINSGIFKKQFKQDEDNINSLKQNFENNFTELKSRGLHLIDLIVLLKEMSKSDLQQFKTENSQNLTVQESLLEKSKKSEANDHLARLKCAFIYNSLCARKISDKIENDFTTSKAIKVAVEKLKIDPSDINYETKISLLEMQAENDALIATNKYIENYIESMISKTEAVVKNVRYKKMCSKDVTCIMQLFYEDADLTYNLLYAFPLVTQKVINYLSDIKVFASEDLFKLEYPEEKIIESLKEDFSYERKQTWNYCAKTKLIEPFFAGTLGNELPVDVCRSLNIEPYQSISVLCENWTRFKQKLYAEVAADPKICVTQCDVSASDVYSNILKLLEKMKFSIEKAMIALDYGASYCNKNKLLIDEWWNQSAQYIPHIEYEGKTLKMWIDILLVLSDFELQNHA